MTPEPFSSHPFADADLPRLRRFLVDSWRRTGPRAGNAHPGDLLWARYRLDDDLTAAPEWVRIWERDGAILGYSWLYPPNEVELNFDPDWQADQALVRAMLEDADERRRPLGDADPDSRLKTLALAGNQAWTTTLAGLGFVQTDDPAQLFFTRDLAEPIPGFPLPPDFTIRPPRDEDAEIAERVAIHREVWHPSKVPETAYRRLRTIDGYDPELDLVAVGPDGVFAAYAQIWRDAENRTGEFEPVGARPAFRRRGLAIAVLAEGLRRLRDRGAETAVVYTTEDREPARRLYEAIGFRVIDQWRYWRRGDAMIE